MAYQGVYNDSLVTGSLQIGAGTPGALGQAIIGFGKIVMAVIPVSVAAGTTVEQAVTVPGVALGDYVEVCPPALTNGVILANSRVSAINTVQFQWSNVTAGALVPPAGNYIFLIVR